MYRLQKLWRPGIFQGHNRKDNYFEGWYFKLVDSRSENVIAVIPGVSIQGPGGGSHAFLQLLDGKTATSSYYKFSIGKFSYRKDSFSISIGKNRFSADRMFLDEFRNGKAVKADIKFRNQLKWPVSFLSPGAMGWYTFVPFMECYHGVLSMDHDLEGSLEIGGNVINFNGGRGYIEKDWGRSFPRGWIWLQSNNFDKKDRCSIMLSIARIPWRGRSFTGFICGFLYKKSFYVFATYNGSRIEDISYQGHDRAKVKIIRRDIRLEVDVSRKNSVELASPIMGAMEGRINESIDSVIRVDLFRDDQLIFGGDGRCAGFEMVNPEILDY